MKRTLVVLGVTAAVAVAPSVASAGTPPQSKSSPEKAVRLPAAELSLQMAHDSRSGHTLYRLGNFGLWME